MVINYIFPTIIVNYLQGEEAPVDRTAGEPTSNMSDSHFDRSIDDPSRIKIIKKGRRRTL